MPLPFYTQQQVNARQMVRRLEAKLRRDGRGSAQPEMGGIPQVRRLWARLAPRVRRLVRRDAR